MLILNVKVILFLAFLLSVIFLLIFPTFSDAHNSGFNLQSKNAAAVFLKN